MYRIMLCHRFPLNLTLPVTVKALQNIKICGYASMPVEQKKDIKMNPEIDIASTNATTINKLMDQIDPISVSKQRPSLFTETIEASKDLLKTDETLEKTPLPFEEIPSPAILRFLDKYWKYVPLLGQLSWSSNVVPMKFLFNEYGPVVRLHGLLMNSIVMIHRPEHIAAVLKQENEYPIRSGLDTIQHYRVNMRKYKLPMFSMQGKEWSDLRKKIDKPFNEEIYKFTGKIGIACDELVQRICSIKNRQDEVPANFSDELTRWGYECFAILMLNKKLGFLEPSGYNASSEQLKLIEALTQAQKYMSYCESGFQLWRFFETPYSKKLFGACDIIDGFISKHIRQAENKLRMQVTESKKDDGEFSIIEQLLFKHQLQPEDISTLLMDSILLGVLATSNTQAFLLYSIAKNPRIQNKIYDEITTIAPDEKSINKEKLMSMVYLKACIKECLRLYPAFPYISRLLQKPITLHGYAIPKGTYIIMANKIASQREENFEDPEKFKPERWLVPGGKTNQQQEYSCLPFGHGIRSCVGKSMAEMEIMLLTSTLLRKFKLEYDYANIRGKYLTVSVPNKPLRFRFVDRESK